MTPELKAKWVEALRSGEYKQTAGIMHSDENGEDSFCCLGVLCEVMSVPRYGRGYSFKGFGYKAFGIPRSVLKRTAQSKLIDLNDVEKKSFEQIADWIEEKL